MLLKYQYSQILDILIRLFVLILVMIRKPQSNMRLYFTDVKPGPTLIYFHVLILSKSHCILLNDFNHLNYFRIKLASVYVGSRYI